MTKLYLRDIGSHPERDLEVTLFPDGELQFEADNGKYVHINIARDGVSELIDFFLQEIWQCRCDVPQYASESAELKWCLRCQKPVYEQKEDKL